MSVLQGTVRGLHFQRPPYAETETGAGTRRRFDVAVDLRQDSPTFGEHFAVELTAANHCCLYIPRGFAHGFCTLASNTIVAYKVDHAYSPHAEGGLFWNDPNLHIGWPIDNEPSSISDKHPNRPMLDQLTPLSRGRNED